MKKNTAYPGFVIGKFLQTADGAEKTTGAPTCTRMLDGTGAALTNAAAYDATSGLWKIDLAQADTNGLVVGLGFTLTDCVPITFTIVTVTGVPDANGRMPADTQQWNSGALPTIPTAAQNADAVAAQTDIAAFLAAWAAMVDANVFTAEAMANVVAPPLSDEQLEEMAATISESVDAGLTEAQQAQLTQIEGKVNTLGSGTVQVTPSVDDSTPPVITIVIGDAYGQTNGRPAIVFIDESDQWPSNVGDGTITFSVKKFARDVELAVTATLTTVDGHKAASVAMTSEETSALSYTPNHKYDLRVHWSNGDNMALINPPGDCTVTQPVTPVVAAESSSAPSSGSSSV